MGFLDASGDIILDGTLTELGRKRMANGNFQIVKFTLGDDEIDYQLYDKNHASGTAYYDLEILQTPVFEASTGINANINYGLVTYSKQNLLYMPTMKRNNKVQQAAAPHNGVFYLAVNDGTTSDALITAFGGINGGGHLKVLQAGQKTGTKIIMETGLATTELAGDAASVANYVTAQGLRSTGFEVSLDTRFFTRIYQPTAGSTMNNNGGNGEAIVKFNLQATAPTARDQKRRHNSLATIRALPTNVVRRQNDAKAHTETTQFNVPASCTALNFDLKIISNEMFSRYGQNVTVVGSDGNVSCRSIDTMVILTDKTSGATQELPIRIVKKI
tara:strand:+ start:252 stop:1241 length:990 start_codon:yes stop_codon:yes gene_type:complete